MGLVHCSWDSQISFSVNIIFNIGLMALLIHLKIILLQYFQFSVISDIQTDLYSQNNKAGWYLLRSESCNYENIFWTTNLIVMKFLLLSLIKIEFKILVCSYVIYILFIIDEKEGWTLFTRVERSSCCEINQKDYKIFIVTYIFICSAGWMLEQI